MSPTVFLLGVAPSTWSSPLSQSLRETVVPPIDLPPPPSQDVPSTAALEVAQRCLEDMKAEDTVAMDLQGKTSLADWMVVTSGRSQRHVGSIADKVIQGLKESGVGRVRVEGMPACDWVLIDAGDVIVHVFRPEVRTFYNLEKIWGVDRVEDPAKG